MISERVQQAIKDLILDSDGQTAVSDVVITFSDRDEVRYYSATFTCTEDTAWAQYPLSWVESEADHEDAMIDVLLELSDIVWSLPPELS